MYSNISKQWFVIENVLVDTGADISVLPYSQGMMLIGEIEKGKKMDVGGIVPYARLVVYLHSINARIDGNEMEIPVLVAETDDVPPILGRAEAIDRYFAQFYKGKELSFSVK